MDQVSLVDRRIDDGQRLALELVRDKFDVTAAFWVKTSESGWWYLYIASRVVDKEGPASAYRRLQKTLGRLPGTTISLTDVKVIGASNPTTRDVLKLQKRYPERTPIPYHGAQLGGIGIDEAYIYPPPLKEKRSPFAWEKGRLKTAVEQTTRIDELLKPLSPQERRAMDQLVSTGISPTQADYWIRKKRELECPRPAIPAGTVVKTQLAAWWGDRPEDDANPLLLVEAPDGAQGLTFQDNTEPV